MLLALGRAARRWARTNPFTDVYGAARSLLALATALTLACTPGTVFFRPAAGGMQSPFCAGAQRIGLFCVAPAAHLDLARWLAALALLLVASGYRPRWTALVHWWVSFSFQANALGIDGGDNLTEDLTLLLLPIALLDGRRWHWQATPDRAPENSREEVTRLVALFFLLLLRVQMAGVYFHAAVGKFQVEQWTNGTAVWYWATSRSFGPPALVSALLVPLFAHGAITALVTWWVMVTEWLLSTALFMTARMRRVLLWNGVAFHVGIIVLHGLWTFSLAMFAGLILYLWPVDRPLLRKADRAR